MKVYKNWFLVSQDILLSLMHPKEDTEEWPEVLDSSDKIIFMFFFQLLLIQEKNAYFYSIF